MLSNPLSDNMDRRGVGKFDLVLRSLHSHNANNGSSIIHVAYDDGAAIITDVEDISDGVWHNQFIRDLLLTANYNAILTPDCYGSLTELLDGLKCIFHLVNSSVWGEYLHQLFEAHSFFIFIFIIPH